MRTPGQAIAEILSCIEPLVEQEPVRLADAVGRVLSAEVVSDVDLPPFVKSMMDGYALRAADSGPGAWSLRVLGESRAGVGFPGAIGPGECVAIYTGAELPAGADAVVMVERTREEGAGEARRMHAEDPVAAGEHVSPTGEILGRGRSVFSRGHRVDAGDLPVLAAVGADPVSVFRRPRVSVLTTGDELVPPSEVPGPGQIREGNTLFLAAALRAAGCELLEVGVVPDDRAALEAAFARALEEGDALVTTGGVSMGKYDLVGEAFRAVGVELVLHKVAIKPGKPIWFGRRGKKPVFGLPGNPVSSLLGFEVFLRPALARLAGGEVEDQGEDLSRGRWDGPPRVAGDRQLNVPVAVGQDADGVPLLSPVPFRGSADVVAVSGADGFAVLAAGSVVSNGELISWRPFARRCLK